MSRHLPARANLEHLKKQARRKLADLRPSRPDVQLADAQHLLAREYGFASWPRLKAHVEAAAASAEPLPRAVAALAGTWRLIPSDAAPLAFVGAMLHFTVADKTVTVADTLVDASGRQEHGINTLHADGREYQQPHGFVVAARWRGDTALEAVVTRNGVLEGTVRYQVSPDGRTLTVVAGEQRTMFERV